MKVYICFECYYEGGGTQDHYQRVFLKEEDAIAWVDAVEETASVWREYRGEECE
jgi:hypothetical protein